ncbi:hypothetical protein [Myroides pelagicus]|uniref:Uncharacterized protein n=1 Tax=Myroides pelagicus TaxID=270914 RepID=A0A7K1GHE2_9FLAO|nr:hypothetical protein [Myroides pelagicus]MTH28422.1 hypothetical protein [Myroides pelagicus]
MEDSMNALQSYLDTLKEKGFTFQLLNNNNESILLSVVNGVVVSAHLGGFVKRVIYAEERVSDLLEEVEYYVESIIETRS